MTATSAPNVTTPVVVDGSLYPRAPGIPPSMTIAALAERQAALMT